MTGSVTKHLVISGRVQGVGYRAWLAKAAAEKNLSGWVRNCSDGTVEALLHGPSDRVAAVIERAQRGPLLASVNHVAATDARTYEGPDLFETRASV